MVHVACPLCGADRTEKLFEARDRLGLSKETFTLVRCRGCGLAYLDPRPEEERLAGLYPREYWGGQEKGLKELVRGFEERLKEGYKLSALSAAGLTGGRLLDIGCGRGEFIARLRDRGFTVAGIEPGSEAARRGRDEFGLDIMHGSLGEAPLPVGGFDAATMWHVLEHFPDPLAALEATRRALAPGGVLICALPDFGGWQAGFFRENWFGIDAPRHMTHFTRETASAMLKRAGFSVRCLMGGGARYETAMLVRSALPGLNRLKLDALERGAYARYIYKAAQLLLDIALLPAGAAIAATGRGSTFIVVADRD